jgi:hypothetical protein
MYTYVRPQAGLRQTRGAGRRNLSPPAIPRPWERRGDCSGWMNNPQSFSKAIADHYVNTEYPGRLSRAYKPKCSYNNKICHVYYTNGITVMVSFANLPNYVIARRVDPTGPRCEYDFDCLPSGELVFKRLGCGS